MESTWKSGNEREALQFLRPNPFFVGIVRMLLEAQKVCRSGVRSLEYVREGFSGVPRENAATPDRQHMRTREQGGTFRCVHIRCWQGCGVGGTPFLFFFCEKDQ